MGERPRRKGAWRHGRPDMTKEEVLHRFDAGTPTGKAVDRDTEIHRKRGPEDSPIHAEVVFTVCLGAFDIINE